MDEQIEKAGANEARVGYKSISILCDMLEEYIKKSVDVSGKFNGNPTYIKILKQYVDYLEK